MSTYKVLGIVSAERPCECCGNTRLERSVVLQDETGLIQHVGSDCAGKLLNGRKGKGTKRIVKVASVMQKALAMGDAKRAEDYVFLHLGSMDSVVAVREHYASV